MKEKVCCVYDENERYAVKLTDYINDSHMLPYQAMAFSSEDALFRCLGKYDIEFILSGKKIEDKLKSDQEIMCLTLVDDNASGENEIYRFQSAECILQEVVSHISGFSRSFQATDRTKLISVYSPATKCFKTTFSLSLAAAASEKGRTLWISFEQFSGLSNVLLSSKGGLSEALYQFRIGGNKAYGKIAGCTDSSEGFDYLGPVLCADDIADTDTKEMLDFIEMVGREGAYSYVIADVGCVFNRPWELLESSEKIIMPKPLDYMGRRKEEDFNTYLKLSGRIGLSDRIERVEIPYIDRIAGYEIEASTFVNDELLECAGRHLNG